MASNTKNVKLGVCKVLFDGVDLGYTQGGVEVSVKTETHKLMVDQFGKTAINEYVMGRECAAKVPLAETTLENMVAIMPGATLQQTGGAAATGTITFATTASANADTVTVNGSVFTFKTAPAAGVNAEVALGATFTASAQNLYAALLASTDPLVTTASYTIAGAVITVKFGPEVMYGTTGKNTTDGNTFSLAKSGTNVTVTALLTGGANSTSQYVSVTSGVGADLLSIARELRFRPVSKYNAAGVFNGDFSEDFAMPLAATAGALTFAYKLENERVYNVDFTGYPDPVTNKLFTVGV